MQTTGDKEREDGDLPVPGSEILSALVHFCIWVGIMTIITMAPQLILGS